MPKSTENPYTIQLDPAEAVLMHDVIEGTITSVDRDNKTVDVVLDEPYYPRNYETDYGKLEKHKKYEHLDIEPITEISGAKIIYNCQSENLDPASAFHVNDKVLIYAVNGEYYCVGFPDKIKRCGEILKIDIDGYVILWDLELNDYVDIPKLTFPCSSQDPILIDYLSRLSRIGLCPEGYRETTDNAIRYLSRSHPETCPPEYLIFERGTYGGVECTYWSGISFCMWYPYEAGFMPCEMLQTGSTRFVEYCTQDITTWMPSGESCNFEEGGEFNNCCADINAHVYAYREKTAFNFFGTYLNLYLIYNYTEQQHDCQAEDSYDQNFQSNATLGYYKVIGEGVFEEISSWYPEGYPQDYDIFQKSDICQCIVGDITASGWQFNGAYRSKEEAGTGELSPIAAIYSDNYAVVIAVSAYIIKTIHGTGFIDWLSEYDPDCSVDDDICRAICRFGDPDCQITYKDYEPRAFALVGKNPNGSISEIDPKEYPENIDLRDAVIDLVNTVRQEYGISNQSTLYPKTIHLDIYA